MVSFPKVSPPNPCILSAICATFPTHLILPDLIIRIISGEKYRSKSSSLRSILQFLVTSPRLALNIFLNTLFSNTLSLCFSLNMTDQAYTAKNIKPISRCIWNSCGNSKGLFPQLLAQPVLRETFLRSKKTFCISPGGKTRRTTLSKR